MYILGIRVIEGEIWHLQIEMFLLFSKCSTINRKFNYNIFIAGYDDHGLSNEGSTRSKEQETNYRRDNRESSVGECCIITNQ
jgi:hypothetical protein